MWRGVLRTVATHQGPLNVHVKMDSNLIKTTMQPVKVLNRYHDSVFSFLFYLLNYLLVSFFIVCVLHFFVSLSLIMNVAIKVKHSIFCIYSSDCLVFFLLIWVDFLPNLVDGFYAVVSRVCKSSKIKLLVVADVETQMTSLVVSF